MDVPAARRGAALGRPPAPPHPPGSTARPNREPPPPPPTPTRPGVMWESGCPRAAAGRGRRPPLEPQQPIGFNRTINRDARPRDTNDSLRRNPRRGRPGDPQQYPLLGYDQLRRRAKGKPGDRQSLQWFPGQGGRDIEPLGLDGDIRHARGHRVARQRRITGRSPPPRSHHEPHEQHEQRRRTGNRDPPFHARYLPSVVLRGAPVNLLVTTG